MRAAMGHPEPWELNFMAIGNEVGCQTGSNSEPLRKNLVLGSWGTGTGC